MYFSAFVFGEGERKISAQVDLIQYRPISYHHNPSNLAAYLCIVQTSLRSSGASVQSTARDLYLKHEISLLRYFRQLKKISDSILKILQCRDHSQSKRALSR
jgi:hypothetical protein